MLHDPATPVASPPAPLLAGRRYGAPPRVALVGNPNCGKTTLFNALTRSTKLVGNWAGVTVDVAGATYVGAAGTIQLADLPGVYSLTSSSLDEAAARDDLIDVGADVVVNVLDASRLERNLYLTMQVLELGVPVVVALNMVDTAREQGSDIDPAALAQLLGCPVVPVVASSGDGLSKLVAAIDAMLDAPVVSDVEAVIPSQVETAVQQLAAAAAGMPGPARTRRPERAARWTALRLLEHDSAVVRRAPAAVLELRDQLEVEIEAATGDEPDLLIADARYVLVGEIAAASVRRRGEISTVRARSLDRIVLHPRFGVPLFFAVMYVVFLLTINVGSAFIDLFDILAGLVFVDTPRALLEAIAVPEAIIVVLADGLGGGLQAVATFIPPVGIMFLCLKFLEDSGYMARAAFVMDRWMRAIGLPGKAFVPMIVGFGCNVPAIMGARTLERERDRRLAVTLNPFMSCGARLPVYALFAAAFFPASGQLVVFALYLTGIGFAVLTGLILRRTLLKGELAPFIMELPPYHRPTMRGVAVGAWRRLRSFLVGAGKLIVPVVAVLTLLGSLGTDGSFGNQDGEASVLSAAARTATPVLAPMGVEADNWPATVGIITGIFAKEAVVGSLDALYSQVGAGDGAADGADAGYDPVGSIGEAAATVPAGLGDALRGIFDPLGLSVGAIEDPSSAAEEQGVDRRTYDAMTAGFDGQVGAFAYLLFVLLYVPCVAATAAIYRTTSLSWAMFVAAWTTGLAFLAATLFYQAATFADHPGSSMAWIIGLLGAFACVVLWMRRMGHTAHGEEPPRPGTGSHAAVHAAAAPRPASTATPPTTAASTHGDEPAVRREMDTNPGQWPTMRLLSDAPRPADLRPAAPRPTPRRPTTQRAPKAPQPVQRTAPRPAMKPEPASGTGPFGASKLARPVDTAFTPRVRFALQPSARAGGTARTDGATCD